MIEKKYTKKDGSEGSSYKFEENDSVQFQRMGIERETKFGTSYSIQLVDGTYVNITGGQHDSLVKGNVEQGDTITAHMYTNKFGTFVGLNVVKADPSQQTLQATATPPTMDNWEEFSKAYMEQTAGSNDANYVHMVGAYVVHYHAEEFKVILDKSKEAFTK